MTDSDAGCLFMVVMATVAGAAGIGGGCVNSSWKNAAIREGVASYDPATKEFKWKGESDKPSEPKPELKLGQPVVVLHSTTDDPFFEGKVLAFTADGQMAKVADTGTFQWQHIAKLRPIATPEKVDELQGRIGSQATRQAERQGEAGEQLP